jgi:hypothetical protein
MDLSPRVAGEAGITYLYHYQDFDSGTHTERLVDILQNHRVYCSNPESFNDPWDCKPYFDPDLLDNPIKLAASASALIATRTGGAELDRIDELLRTNPAALKKLVHEFSLQNANFITARWGVYCLSPSPYITLMWSHYSRNHRGICLEFAVPNTKFAAAQKVQYQNEYPSLFLYQPASYLRMLLVKSDVWEYEQEFRLICPRFTDVKGHPLIMDGNHLEIGPNDLRSVIVGCQADRRTVTALESLVKSYAPSVAVRQALRAPNKYSLFIDG